MLADALEAPTLRGDWSRLMPGFPGSKAYESLCESGLSGVSSDKQ
jgi:hypothetical protein